jgi:ketosteroid isomerase-like protein
MMTSDQQAVEMTANEISKLLDHFAEAQRLSDVDSLSELMTDDFKLVGPLGFVVPKGQWLAQFEGGALKIESLEWDEVDIRTHGYTNCAVAIGKLTQTATYADSRSDGAFRVTVIALGHGVSWQLAGAHYSPIGAPARPQQANRAIAS